jgi:O-acetyl-ADP-ribose deacetylase (regulator of RNase III)
MIEYQTGLITESDCEAWVCPVNCVGVMKAPIGQLFVQKLGGEYFDTYDKKCRQNVIALGKVDITYLGLHARPKYVFHFPIVYGLFGHPSYDNVATCLDDLAALVRGWGDLKSIALPPLGCDTGDLDWDEVEDMILTRFTDHPKTFVLYPMEEEGMIVSHERVVCS